MHFEHPIPPSPLRFIFFFRSMKLWQEGGGGSEWEWDRKTQLWNLVELITQKDAILTRFHALSPLFSFVLWKNEKEINKINPFLIRNLLSINLTFDGGFLPFVLMGVGWFYPSSFYLWKQWKKYIFWNLFLHGKI